MNIWNIFIFNPHLKNYPARIIVPYKTNMKLHFFQQSVCFLPNVSAIADERPYLPFNSKLMFLFQRHKIYVIGVNHLPYVLQGKYPHEEDTLAVCMELTRIHIL
jgi:hypothetical protein